MNLVNEDEILAGYNLTNLATFTYYAKRLTNLANTMFKWVNLPDSVNPRFLEKALLNYGVVCFAKDDITGKLIALPCVTNTNLDIYGEPTGVTMFGMNGYQLPVTKDNAVWFWDNYSHTPMFHDILMFAKRLETIERTMDINIEGQRTPYVLSGNKSQINSLKSLWKTISYNSPVAIVDKNFDLDSIKVMPTVAPFVAGELQVIKRNIWNEALGFIGVDNANSEKKERLLALEASGNMGAIKNQRYARLKTRLEAVDKINELFDLDIAVEINTDWTDEVLGLNEEYEPEQETEPNNDEGSEGEE